MRKGKGGLFLKSRDMNQLAGHWQKKRSRMKQVVEGSGLALLAIAVSVLLNVFRGEEIRWVATGALAAAALGVFMFSLIAYTNTMLASPRTHPRVRT